MFDGTTGCVFGAYAEQTGEVAVGDYAVAPGVPDPSADLSRPQNRFQTGTHVVHLLLPECLWAATSSVRHTMNRNPPSAKTGATEVRQWRSSKPAPSDLGRRTLY